MASFSDPTYIIKVELFGYLYCRITLKLEFLLLSFTTFPNCYFLFFTKDYILNGKGGLINMGTLQVNSNKFLLIITSYSIILFWISTLVHYLWSVNPVNQSIFIEYSVSVHFSLEIKSYVSSCGGQSLQKECLSCIILNRSRDSVAVKISYSF